MAIRLLAGTGFQDRHLVPLDGSPVLAAFDRLREALRQGAPRAVDLFAEPHLDPREGAPQRATWYGEASTDPVPVSSLTTTQRLIAEQALRERLEALVPLLADPATAPLLQAALLVPGAEDVLWTGEAPILVNWGVVPAAITRSPEGFAAHFAATLGRFAPPGFTPFPRPVPAAAVAAPVAAMPVAAAAPVAAVATGTWLGAAGATLAAVAIVLLLSGVALVAGYYIGWNRLVARLQAETPPPIDPSLEADMRRLQEGVNDGLRQRIARLEQGLQGDVCVAEAGPLPALPPQGNAPRSAPASPGQGAEAPRQPVLPPPPEQQPLRPPGPEGQAGRAENLADALDRSVVLIVTQRGDGQRGVGIGTGFAIAPDLVVTNRHVIEGAATVYAANRALGRPTQAQVVAQTADQEPGRPDFALLRLPGAQLTPLAITTEVDRLVPVVAAGFPGFVLGEDDDFRRLLGGEAGAIPRAHLTSGEVSSLQPLRGNTVLIHTAAINRGNSGGPLADRCGRVVGINTFIRTDREVAYRADYALPTAMLLPFLQQAGVTLAPAPGVCQPERAAAPATPPAAPATPPAAAPPATPPAAPPASPPAGAAPR